MYRVYFEMSDVIYFHKLKSLWVSRACKMLSV